MAEREEPQPGYCPECLEPSWYDPKAGEHLLCDSCTALKMRLDPEINGIAYDDAPI